MRTINRIIIHCSATKSSVDYSPTQLIADHKARGFRTCGYHYYIQKNGDVNKMRPIEQIGAHALGYNAYSIGICYEGGLDKNGKPSDTRTLEQKVTLNLLVKQLCSEFPIKYISGHRDLSPDIDGDGIVEAEEWIKECPCYDVKNDTTQEKENSKH